MSLCRYSFCILMLLNKLFRLGKMISLKFGKCFFFSNAHRINETNQGGNIPCYRVLKWLLHTRHIKQMLNILIRSWSHFEVSYFLHFVFTMSCFLLFCYLWPCPFYFEVLKMSLKILELYEV